MCEFEKNILQLLKQEKKRLEPIVTDKSLPYLKSLEHGIKKAEKNLEECECKRTLQLEYSVFEPPTSTNFHTMSKKALEYMKCSQ